MKPIVYIFGTLPGGFSSYPQEHAKKFFEFFISKSKNICQIVIGRKDNLIYYGYVRRLHNNKYFGICLCLDCIYKDVSYLFEIFDDIFASMIEKGDVLKFTSRNEIEWATKRLESESVAINEYAYRIEDMLGVSEKNTQPLPPIDFSISINECIEIDIETQSDKIVDISKRYCNIYIVKHKTEIAKISSFQSILEGRDKKIEELNENIKKHEDAYEELKKEISKIRKQKKQFQYVFALSVLVLFCVSSLLFLNKSLNNTRGQLNNANSTIIKKDSVIKNKDGIVKHQKYSIDSLNVKLSEEKNQKETLEGYFLKASGYYPFFVTSCSVNSSCFTFDYFAVDEQEITVTLKAINERNSEVVSKSYTTTFYKGGGSMSLDFYYNLNTSQYYYVVLMCNDNIIAGKRW